MKRSEIVLGALQPLSPSKKNSWKARLSNHSDDAYANAITEPPSQEALKSRSPPNGDPSSRRQDGISISNPGPSAPPSPSTPPLQEPLIKDDGSAEGNRPASPSSIQLALPPSTPDAVSSTQTPVKRASKRGSRAPKAGDSPPPPPEDSGKLVSPSKAVRRVKELIEELLEASLSGDTKRVEALVDVRRLSTESRKTPHGATPLHLAALNGHLDTVHFLLDRGALLEARNVSASTPLILAADMGHLDVVASLIARGASIEAKNNELSSPLSLAARGGHLPVVQLLVAHGASLEAQDWDGRTPLSVACIHGHRDTAAFLLDCGARLDAADTQGFTPLLHACAAGQVEVARMLLDRGCEVAAVADVDGRNALQIASHAGHVGVVRLLLGHERSGAFFRERINVRDSRGRTALALAHRGGHRGVASVLREEGGASPLPAFCAIQ